MSHGHENGEPEAAVMTRVEEILELSKESLRDELLRIVQENESLKARIHELQQLNECKADGFCIDSNPTEEDDDHPLPAIEYSSTLNEVLTVPEATSAVEEAHSSRVKGNNCWNCGKDDHSLRECTEARNHQKINANRKEFLKNQPSFTVRYHVDEPQRFGHLKPGLPSKKLQKALGLHPDQLPAYIYRMRELGYPPGWLKEAEISHSNMGLYVEQNKALPDHGDEEGEISDASDKKQYDVAKIQEWPGFNVPLDLGLYKDEGDYFRVPPMRPEQSKESMLQHMSLKQQKAYVRGEMQDTSTAKSNSEKIVTQTPAKESKVKSVDHGTPIVSSHSHYQNLPPQEKWTTNTTDHIFFENLPESTGKYDQMVQLLKKVRETREASGK